MEADAFCCHCWKLEARRKFDLDAAESIRKLTQVLFLTLLPTDDTFHAAEYVIYIMWRLLWVSNKMICQWQFWYSNGFECKTIPGVETIIINVVLSEYRVKVGVMLKEEEEGYMASMLLLDQQQEHFWEARGHGHTLDQSLISCFLISHSPTLPGLCP